MSVSAPTPVVPADWKIAKTYEVCEVQNGYAFKSEYFNDKSVGLPLIRIRDVHSGRSDTFYSGAYDDRYVVADDDLLIGMDGEFRVRKWRSGRGLLNQRVCRLIPNGEQMTADFLYYSIALPLKQIEDFTPYTTVKHISAGQIRAIELPLPPLPEQKKIAHILSTVQRAIEAQERIIQTTTELKKALMHKLFTEGLRGEPQKQTEIGLVPESWKVTTVGEVTAIKGGKRLLKGDKLVERDTGFPYIRVTDFNEFSVDVCGLLFLTEAAQRPISRYIINRDDVFISIAGSIGITGMIPPELDGANLTENAARLIANDSSQLHPRFLMYWLASDHCQAEIKAQTVKNAQPKLALARIKSLKVPLPTQGEQVEIAKALDLAGCKVENARAKRDQLQNLFRTLLHELMTGKTRVHEIEITA